MIPVEPQPVFRSNNTLISNTRLKSANNQAKLEKKQHAETKLLLFENYLLSSSLPSSKTNIRYSKKCAENKFICFIQII